MLVDEFIEMRVKEHTVIRQLECFMPKHIEIVSIVPTAAIGGVVIKGCHHNAGVKPRPVLVVRLCIGRRTSVPRDIVGPRGIVRVVFCLCVGLSDCLIVYLECCAAAGPDDSAIARRRRRRG